MKNILSIILIYSLLSSYLMSHQPTTPCEEKELVRLKDVNIGDMSDREYQYFLMMSEKCVNYDDQKNLILQKKLSKIAWLMMGTQLIYFVYDEVLDEN